MDTGSERLEEELVATLDVLQRLNDHLDEMIEMLERVAACDN